MMEAKPVDHQAMTEEEEEEEDRDEDGDARIYG
jgi:hypothetical protein